MLKVQNANYKQIQIQSQDFSIMTNFIHILIHSKEKEPRISSMKNIEE